MNVYLDNAATTALDPAVLQAMMPYMDTLCGSPSSIHAQGRKAKVAIEKVRKDVAALLHASPAEIFFTSGGTEANNMALWGSITAQNIQHVITSPIEHQAVLQPLQWMSQRGIINLHWVALDEQGRLQYDHLAHLLQAHDRSLVSLMHANNEIGNLNDLARISALCQAHNVLLHTDAVQTIGHYPINVHDLALHMAVGSAHKFHGPQGVGLLYLKSGTPITPLLRGGAQERNMRAGTENVAGIVGLGKALAIAYQNLSKDQAYIQQLKDRMIERLKHRIPHVSFNGTSAQADESLYTILSVNLPPSEKHEMLLFNLDIHQIAASLGSACASGTHIGSHVLEALNVDPNSGTIRFSFSKYNTAADIDHAVDELASIIQVSTEPIDR